MSTPPLGRRLPIPPWVAITRLTGIDVQVGRTGSLTLVAVLEPVGLGWVVVRRVTVPTVDATGGTSTDAAADD